MLLELFSDSVRMDAIGTSETSVIIMHDVATQNIVFFIVTTVRTPNLTKSRTFNGTIKHAQGNMKYMQSFDSDSVKEWLNVAFHE